MDFKQSGNRKPNSADAAAHLSDLAFQPVLRELQACAGLSDGWDGPTSKAPSAEALSGAHEFVRKLASWANVPDLSVADDGEISIYWKSADSYVDVSFQSNGRASVYGRVGGKIYKSDSASAAGLYIPTPVISHLAPL